MGYADGIEIQNEGHVMNKNNTKCREGNDLHIRCYTKSK